MNNSERLPRKTLFAYGCGDFASNLCWTFIGSYLTIFYTDVVGIAPAAVSAIMLVARALDAVDDPLQGAIIERTRSNKGRFRPYILYGAPILTLFLILTFTIVGKGTTAVVWAAFTYIVCGIIYSIVNLSYGALSTVMTTNQDDIAQLNSWRMMGTNVSAVLLSAITPVLLSKFSGGAQTYAGAAYTKVAIFYGLCALPIFYFVYVNCKEKITPPVSATRVPLSQTIKSVITNKPLIIIFCMQLIALTATFGRLGVVIYYLMYNVKRMDLIPVFMSLPSIMTVLGILITKNYTAKIGKKKMAAIGYIGAGLSLIAIYFVGQMGGYNNIPLLIALHAIFGFFCFSSPIPMAMVADAINYQEDRMGVRADGTSYATVSLSTKLGGAIGVSLALMIMSATGYVPNAQQTATALNGINVAANLVFGIFYLCCLIPLALYPLNEDINAKIRTRLDEKEAAARALENAN